MSFQEDTSDPLIQQEMDYEKTYVCGECSLVTKSLPFIKNHLQNNHVHMKLFKCEANLEKYNCQFCNFTTDLMVLLIRHCQNSHKQSLKINSKNASEAELIAVTSYTCKSCTFETNSSFQLLKHMKTVCLQKEENETIELAGSKVAQLPKSSTEWYQCDKCSFGTAFRIILTQHVTQHKSGKLTWHDCDQCSFTSLILKDVVEHRWEKHTNNVNHTWLKCFRCPFETLDSANLQVHIKVKHGNLAEQWKNPIKDIKNYDENAVWYQCEGCPFRSKHKPTLKDHILLKHPSELKSYKCKHCYFITKSRSTFKTHLTGEHAFVLNDALDADAHVLHEDAHALDKAAHVQLFYCAKCSYKTTCKQSLKQHKTRCHATNKIRNTDVKSQKLDCYLQMTTTKLILNKQLNQRTGTGKTKKQVTLQINTKHFQCPICTYKTKTSELLKKHLAGHLVGGKLQCPHCIFKTSYRYTLTAHIKYKHTARVDTQMHGEVAMCFKCNRCSFRASTKSTLNSHMILSHSNRAISEVAQSHKSDEYLFALKNKSDKLKSEEIAEHSSQMAGWFVCSHCSFITKREESLKDHVAMRHPTPSKVTKYVPRSTSANRNVRARFRNIK